MTAAHKLAIKRGLERAREARLRAKSENASLENQKVLSTEDVLREENASLKSELLRVYRRLVEKE